MKTEAAAILPGLVKNKDGKIVYEASYQGYWRWCDDNDNDQMVTVLKEYSEIVELERKMRPASSSYFALGHALHEMRERLFGQISNFLFRKAGQERTQTLRREFFADLMQARSSSAPNAPRIPRPAAAKSGTAVPGRSPMDRDSKGSRKRGQGGAAAGVAKAEAN